MDVLEKDFIVLGELVERLNQLSVASIHFFDEGRFVGRLHFLAFVDFADHFCFEVLNEVFVSVLYPRLLVLRNLQESRGLNDFGVFFDQLDVHSLLGDVVSNGMLHSNASCERGVNLAENLHLNGSQFKGVGHRQHQKRNQKRAHQSSTHHDDSSEVGDGGNVAVPHSGDGDDCHVEGVEVLVECVVVVRQMLHDGQFHDPHIVRHHVHEQDEEVHHSLSRVQDEQALQGKPHVVGETILRAQLLAEGIGVNAVVEEGSVEEVHSDEHDRQEEVAHEVLGSNSLRVSACCDHVGKHNEAFVERPGEEEVEEYLEDQRPVEELASVGDLIDFFLARVGVASDDAVILSKQRVLVLRVDVGVDPKDFLLLSDQQEENGH